MDFAYDLINDRSATSTPKPPANTSEPTEATTPKQTQAQRQDLSTEFAETIHAFAKSPWGTKLGGWWSTARTQGSQYYETARQEAARREAEAAKALAQARDVVAQQAKVVVEAAEDSLDRVVNEDRRAQEAEKRDVEVDTGKQREGEDTESFLVRFRAEATKRLEEVRKAEDKADEALLRFGTNVRNFLKDAVAISAPGPESQSSEVIFESRDATGKRVIHTSRLDAQLHVIHITPDSFTQDPEASEGWQDFKKGFDIEKRTDGISADLERYPDLRSAMEKLVPEQVEYKDFWMRYYFLRHVVALQEEKRKELLQGKHALVLVTSNRTNF